MTQTIYHRRTHSLKKLCLAQNCDAIIISHKENITYLCGLPSFHPTERESFFLVTPKESILYHSLFIKPPTDSNLICIPMTPTHPFQSVVHTYCRDAVTIGIEKKNLTISELERLQTMLPDATFIAIDDFVAKGRIIKDSTEITYIKKARQITAKALKWAQKFSTSKRAQNITETGLRQHIEDHMMQLGADGFAFPTIVAFGDHTAYPHHDPSHRRLTANTVVLIDVGAKVKGYCADMTRTWFVGKPTPLFAQIETIVKNAHHQALILAKNKTHQPTCQEIDATARRVIADAGYGDFFIHNTGHSLGLEAHEPPSIAPGNHSVLQPGIVITIEPGIYLPGKFGYRHEDTVIIG